MESKLIVSASPHIKLDENTQGVMGWVVIALIPTVFASIYLFGMRSLWIILTCVITCVITEVVTNKFMLNKKAAKPNASPTITGILLAFCLPPTTPLWMAAIGSFIAIFIVKQLFGGLGYNIFNPALAARAILLASWPAAMTTWIKPVCSWAGSDAITSASPLAIVKMKLVETIPSYSQLFMGTIPGSLGETCKLTLLIGAAILFLKKIIDWRIPFTFIGVVALLSFAFGRDPLFEIFSGGIILGAFFMATDMVTAPTSTTGKLIFGCGCGAITALIRNFGGFPEGVCYSILFMNCLSPLIEKYARPKRFGLRRKA